MTYAIIEIFHGVKIQNDHIADIDQLYEKLVDEMEDIPEYMDLEWDDKNKSAEVINEKYFYGKDFIEAGYSAGPSYARSFIGFKVGRLAHYASERFSDLVKETDRKVARIDPIAIQSLKKRIAEIPDWIKKIMDLTDWDTWTNWSDS